MTHVDIRFHAALRELAGTSRLALTLRDGTREALIEALVAAHPGLAPHLPRVRLAVDDEFADGALALRDGAVVDLLPPVAGGSAVARAAIVTAPIGLDALYDAVSHAGAGAVVLFVGVVRDHAEGKPVTALRYEHHETLAEKELRRVLEGVCAEWPGVRLAAEHRVGALAVGDRAVVVAASAAHRGEAFEAGRAAIDRLKETVPIWKHESGPDGAHWVRFEGG